MIIKSNEDEIHDEHLSSVYKRVQQYNMRLSPEKCTLKVKTDNFFGLWPHINMHKSESEQMWGSHQYDSVNNEERSDEAKWDVESLKHVYFHTNLTHSFILQVLEKEAHFEWTL